MPQSLSPQFLHQPKPAPSSCFEPRPDPRQILARLGVVCSSSEGLLATLPFTGLDLTAGSESELQAVVVGGRGSVDLPLTIAGSDYYANLLKRAKSGDASGSQVRKLESFLAENPGQAWENSWVRFSAQRLCPYAHEVFARDLLADKRDPQGGKRGDLARFTCTAAGGEELLRVPVSYLVKLALADLLGSSEALPAALQPSGRRLLDHFLSDNTSPETFSFHVVPLTPAEGMGRALAAETAKRFLLTDLLTSYANLRFGLLESGQRAMIYFAPHPPVRQKRLNDSISDAFYRELFMSPCLSGWDQGESKHRYMQLCHQVLSRSQLNAVAKLREAGIITRNLVVLPNMSNVSLANNGTHISLGSRRLTAEMAGNEPGYGATEEKSLGDLAIKIQEHFLPLFAGSYSAAPYRLGFADFHPEKVLGFLPHELDFTHLRMLWRRWKKKARISVFGQALTPFGPEWLDQGLSRLLGLRGDLVPDFRLVDYPAAFLSTAGSPALNGRLGNQAKLKGDLADLGVFDRQMSLYQFFKLREFSAMGFTGFEGRHYSLFESLTEDYAQAASLQALVTALAFKYMATGQVSHRHIPDDPVTESERRQIFFGMSVGIPTFYVRRTTRNQFLLKILRRVDKVRVSRRYPGYFRVPNRDYCLALLELLREDAAELIEGMDLGGLPADLQLRLGDPATCSTAGKLTRGVLAQAKAPSALGMEAEAFNLAAEEYYRTTLRGKHLAEALAFLESDLEALDRSACDGPAEMRGALQAILGEQSAGAFLRQTRPALLAGTAPLELQTSMIQLLLLSLERDRVRAGQQLQENSHEYQRLSPVHSAR